MRIDIGEWCIRSFTAADAAAIVKYANNHRIAVNLRDRFPYPYTRADADAFLNAAMSQRPESDFAIASAHEIIGGVGYHRQSDVYRLSAEVGYWVGEPFWGRGIATRVVSVPCFELLFEASDAARRAVIGDAPVKVGIEAAVRQGWDAIIGTDGRFVGMTSFGASAPTKDLYKHFGITVDAIVAAATR